MEPYWKTFFVLNGLQSGERGVYAVTTSGRQLEDGWYVLLGDETDPGDNCGPFLSCNEANEFAHVNSDSPHYSG